MAILNFPGIAGASVPMVNTQDGSNLTGAYAEYAIKITVDVGQVNGGRKSSISTFGVYHTSQENCDIFAGRVYQIITDMSKGAAVSMYKKMGSFAAGAGVGNSPIQYGETKYGVITWTNGLLNGETGTPPRDTINGQLYIPFVDVDTMSAQLQALNELIAEGHLARARFNSNASGYEVGIARARLGVSIKDFNATAPKSLGRADTAVGIADGVLEDRALESES